MGSIPAVLEGSPVPQRHSSTHGHEGDDLPSPSKGDKDHVNAELAALNMARNLGVREDLVLKWRRETSKNCSSVRSS